MPASCTEPAYVLYTCADCDCDYKVYDSTSLEMGHDFGEWTDTLDANCSHNGQKTRECVDYYGDDECIVTTRETYYVQMPGEPLQLLTQECQYIVIKDNAEWKLTDFAAPVEVLLRINQ